MAFQYLNSDDLFDAFNDSKKYMRPLFEPFQEFERIARNRPHPGIDKNYPRVTDGTTSSVIEKTPRRILQQIPTGSAHSDTNDWLTHVAGFILTNKIIPNANSQYPFLQKCQAAVSKALTYGSQPAYIPFVNRGKYFGPDMVLPYVKDVFLEPGKLSDADSNYILLRSWYQPRDIKAIIAKSSKLKQRDIEDGWDTAALAQIQDSLSQKDDLSTTPNEKDKNNRNGGIEIIHAFQRGIGGDFYSFHMGTKTLVRTKTNKDPRGEMPIHYLYAGIDVSNPLGRGFVEMVGAMQNLMDAEVQMYQYNRALMLNPPIIKRGEWNKNQAKMAPNTLWDLGSNPNASAEALKIDSTAIANFPQNYGLMQSQIYQLLSAPNANISSQTGTQSFSKTQAGVQQQTSNLNVDDNYIRKQTEAWLEKVFETQLNLYFAEKNGVEELQLDQDTANEIRDINGSENLISPDNKIRIDYSTETEALNFYIDPGTSEEKDDTQEVQELKEILADVNQNPYSIQYIQQAGKELQLGEVYKQLFERLKLQNIDKILTDVPKDAEGKPQTTPPMAIDKPKLTIHYSDVHSPTVKAALLQNAGIQADPQDIAQSDQMAAQLEAQAKAPAQSASPAEDHPIIKLMTSLNIKFTDLPEDSKQEVLNIIGVPTTMQSPTAQDLSIKAAATSNQIMDSHQTAQHNQDQLAANTAQQSAQMAQDQQQFNTTTSQQAQQSNQQHQLAQQQAQNAATQASTTPARNQNKNVSKTPSTSPLAGVAPSQPSSAFSPEDQAYIQELKKYGIADQQIGQALAMLHHGYPAEDVLKMIGASHG